jgi:hypothetical protein
VLPVPVVNNSQANPYSRIGGSGPIPRRKLGAEAECKNPVKCDEQGRIFPRNVTTKIQSSAERSGKRIRVTGSFSLHEEGPQECNLLGTTRTYWEIFHLVTAEAMKLG